VRPEPAFNGQTWPFPRDTANRPLLKYRGPRKSKRDLHQKPGHHGLPASDRVDSAVALPAGPGVPLWQDGGVSEGESLYNQHAASASRPEEGLSSRTQSSHRVRTPRWLPRRLRPPSSARRSCSACGNGEGKAWPTRFPEPAPLLHSGLVEPSSPRNSRMAWCPSSKWSQTNPRRRWLGGVRPRSQGHTAS